jgi:hypothetical protein
MQLATRWPPAQLRLPHVSHDRAERRDVELRTRVPDRVLFGVRAAPLERGGGRGPSRGVGEGSLVAEAVALGAGGETPGTWRAASRSNTGTVLRRSSE